MAEAAASSPSRLARIIQPMVADGLVTREAAADDGRASVVALTDEGLDRLAQAWPAHLAGVRALVIDHIDPAELADFSRGYGAVVGRHHEGVRRGMAGPDKHLLLPQVGGARRPRPAHPLRPGGRAGHRVGRGAGGYRRGRAAQAATAGAGAVRLPSQSGVRCGWGRRARGRRGCANGRW